MTLVFVYGTLKRGSSNHSFLDGQEFLGEARTAPGYTLFNLDGYPGMVRQDGDPEGVRGEVWSVDDPCLEGLDGLEGTSEGLYRRELVPLVAPFAGRRVEAYLYLRDLRGRPRVGAEWFG
jgi:gamma-glutamylaminecyclotransferase